MQKNNLSEREYFYVADGSVLTSISDFTRLLKSIDESLFSQYVTDTKNDFYNWVSGAIRNAELADLIRNAKTSQEMLSAVKLYYNNISNSAGSDDSTENELSGSKKQMTIENKSKKSFNSKGSISKKTLETKKEIKKEITETSMDDDLDRIGRSLSLLKTSGGFDDDFEISKQSSSKIVSGKKTFASKRAKKKTSVSTKKANVKRSSSKTAKQKQKTSHGTSSLSDIKQSFDDTFDFSLDLDNQRDVLSKIRQRISMMDSELKGSTSSFSLNSLKKDVDSSYPELEHVGISSKELRSKNKLLHTVKHHVSHHISRAHKAVSYHVRNTHKKLKNAVVETKKKMEINQKVKSITRAEQKQIKARVPKQNSLYGSGLKIETPVETSSFSTTSTLESDSAVPETKHLGFFKRLANKLHHAEKVVATDLPNLHEFAHERRAEERFNPYENIEHPKNYHNHGLPDFVRGLLIGILIGMIFLAIF